jgi:hypothetical protein
MNGSYFDGDIGNGSPVLVFPEFPRIAPVAAQAEMIAQPAPVRQRELAFA